jgi:serine/threonine-protein kinase
MSEAQHPDPTLPPTASDDPLVGRVIAGRLRIERLLGVGTMGKVYRAEHLALAQPVAVKVLHRHLMGDESLARRFQREAKSAFALRHPNSISIHDFGATEEGMLYIAMELLGGRSLHDVLADAGPLPPERIERILSQVCLALDAAHFQRIVHRDLKPENIMVEDRRGDPDFVKVCDFGIAKVIDPQANDPAASITLAGMVCGTPEYMSPEQARGDPLDGRSDLYSLGVILYQMVTGRLPFTASTALGCVTRHLTEPPPPPREVRPDLRIPLRMEAFILRCLAKHADERPASALAFRDELMAVLHAPPTDAAPDHTVLAPAVDLAPVELPAPVPRPRRQTAGRHRAWLVAAGALAVVGVAAGVLLVPPRGRSGGSPPGPTPGALAGPVGGADAAAIAAPDAAVARGVLDAAAAAPAVDAALLPRRPGGRSRAPVEAVAQPRPRERPVEPPVEPPALAGPDERFRQAVASFNLGQIGPAIQGFLAVLQARPGHAPSLSYLGKAYLRQGSACTALGYFRRYDRVAPGDYFVRQHIETLGQKCGGMQ